MTRKKLAIYSILGLLLFGGLAYFAIFGGGADLSSSALGRGEAPPTHPLEPGSGDQVVGRFRALEARERELDRRRRDRATPSRDATA